MFVMIRAVALATGMQKLEAPQIKSREDSAKDSVAFSPLSLFVQ